MATTTATPQTANLLPLVPVSLDDTADFAKAIDIVCDAFGPMPVSFAVMYDEDKVKERVADFPSLERRRHHYNKYITAAAQHGAQIVHTGDWSVVAVWEPPDTTDAPRRDPSPLVLEWTTKNRAVKQQAMPDPSSESGIGKYWHLNYIARNPKLPKVPGALSAAIWPYLEKAKAEGLPVWLEAASPMSRDIYQYYGFRLVAEVTCGVGAYGADGFPKEGGEGFQLWCMIWDAHLPSTPAA